MTNENYEQLSFDLQPSCPEDKLELSRFDRFKNTATRIGRYALKPAACVAVGLAAVTVLGGTEKDLGVAKAEFSMQFGGDTEVNAGPVGSIDIDTHDGPIGQKITITEVNPDDESVQRVLDDPKEIESVEGELIKDVEQGSKELMKSNLLLFSLGAVGAAGVGLAYDRRKYGELKYKNWAIAGALTLAVPGVAGAWTYQSQNTNPEFEYSGFLEDAGEASIDVEKLLDGYSKNRNQVAKSLLYLTSYVSEMEQAPTLPTDGTVILLAGDEHSQPFTYDLLNSAADISKADILALTGDSTDQGLEVENAILSQLQEIDIPIYQVPGNHESDINREYMDSLPQVNLLRNNQFVLEDSGIVISGVEDPRFTPSEARTVTLDESEVDEQNKDSLSVQREEIVGILNNPTSKKTDILMVHDKNALNPDLLKLFDVPYVFTGHTHKPKVEQVGDTIVLNPGSVGGASLRAFEGAEEGKDPTHQTAMVVYMNNEKVITDVLTLDYGPTGSFGLKVTHCKPHDNIEACNS